MLYTSFGVTKTANASSANVYARPPGYTSKRSSAVLNNYLSWTRKGFGKLLVQENPRSVVSGRELVFGGSRAKTVMSIAMITSLNTRLGRLYRHTYNVQRTRYLLVCRQLKNLLKSCAHCRQTKVLRVITLLMNISNTVVRLYWKRCSFCLTPLSNMKHCLTVLKLD